MSVFEYVTSALTTKIRNCVLFCKLKANSLAAQKIVYLIGSGGRMFFTASSIRSIIMNDYQ